MRTAILGLAVAIVAAGPVSAVTVIYTERAAYVASVSGFSSETFNALTQPTSFRSVALQLTGFTVFGYGISQATRNVVDIPPAFASDFDIDGTVNLAGVAAVDNGIVITFATPISSFGADFGDLGGVELQFGSESLTAPPSAGVSFFGFSSDTSFDRVVITRSSGSDLFSLDNFVFGGTATPSLIPEPASWTLLITGFAMAGTALRRRRGLAAQ